MTQLLLTLTMTFGGGAAWAADWIYTVRPGDGMWTLARRFCREKDCGDAVLKHNGLASPLDLQAGMRLRFPVEALWRQPVQAHVVGVEGVGWHHDLAGNKKALLVGQVLTIGDHISTEQGSATVAFADDSQLLVGEQTEVVFDMLGAFGDTGMVDTSLRILRGRLEPKVVPANRGSRFQIATPTGTAVVRGTEFRIRAEDAGFTELTTGSLDFGSTRLDPGFGLVTRANATPPPPEALLPPAVFARSEWQGPAPMAVSWAPVPNAAGYVFLLFNDATPPTLITALQVAQAQVSVPGVQPGRRYRGVLRAVAASGLEGLDATIALLPVANAPTIGDAISVPVSEAVPLTWTAVDEATGYHLQVADDTEFSAMRADAKLTETRATYPLRAGHYYWRVQADTPHGATDYSSTGHIQVTPPAPEVSVGTRSWQAGAVRLQWTDTPGALFTVQTATDDDFADIVNEWQTPLRSWGLIPANGESYVRVRAAVNGTLGPWSNAVRLNRGGWLGSLGL